MILLALISDARGRIELISDVELALAWVNLVKWSKAFAFAHRDLKIRILSFAGSETMMQD